MAYFLDASATDEEALELLQRFGKLAHQVTLYLAFGALASAIISFVGAYRLYVGQDVVVAHAPGGAVYLPATYADGVRPEVPVAITEEMTILRNGGL
ncbi:hypothetical protein RAS12_30310 (plasmid) [Achromobacter seleniivolatilans]|uniref:Uncharacterized protein n=1 Tax=Achromobacter seleniivolatilans TaxID=3047478 RepID=A0ABY9MBE2_9BURK|nr:hypothetical protein [Achromobacter sp. R39]WMD23928.1 hypothetical protein RAS12_30310 [Achromobacter sp. R39]